VKKLVPFGCLLLCFSQVQAGMSLVMVKLAVSGPSSTWGTWIFYWILFSILSKALVLRFYSRIPLASSLLCSLVGNFASILPGLILAASFLGEQMIMLSFLLLMIFSTRIALILRNIKLLQNLPKVFLSTLILLLFITVRFFPEFPIGGIGSLQPLSAEAFTISISLLLILGLSLVVCVSLEWSVTTSLRRTRQDLGRSYLYSVLVGNSLVLGCLLGWHSRLFLASP
jgi:hypothetical protein